MTRIAILNSETLLGKELKESLRGRPELAGDVRLLTTVEDDAGAVTEGAEGAAFVQQVSDESLIGADLVVICPGPAPAGEGWAPPGSTLLYVDPSQEMPSATSVVAGVNLDHVVAGGVLVSPHPAIVALALILDPLRQYGLLRAACWALLPASIHGQAGIDELLEQTRSVLRFETVRPTDVFGHQLAFNLLPSRSSSRQLAGEISRLVGDAVHPSLQILQAGSFHGLTAGVQVELSDPPTPEDLTDQLTDGPYFERSDVPQTVGPVAASGRASLLLGPVESSPGRPGGMTLWAVMDNLVAGGAGNVVAILEALLAPRH